MERRCGGRRGVLTTVTRNTTSKVTLGLCSASKRTAIGRGDRSCNALAVMAERRSVLRSVSHRRDLFNRPEETCSSHSVATSNTAPCEVLMHDETKDPQKPKDVSDELTKLSRREVLRAGMGAAALLSIAGVLGMEGIDVALAEKSVADPTNMPPQVGDWFVFASGNRKGQIVATSDIAQDGPQLVVWAAQVSNKSSNPEVSLVRNGSGLNKVLLMRFPVEKYGPETKPYVTQAGVVAYSATCTHECCTVTEWEAAQGLLLCPCHGSQYNPLDHAQETSSSPAPRPLPLLPLKSEGAGSTIPAVAAVFQTRVGCGPQQQ